MANEEMRYLKRQSGVSLEVLMKKLDKYKVQYELEMQEDTGRYFRDSIIKVKKKLSDLYNNYDLIPNVQLRQFNIEENCIELNATYNFLIISDSINLKIDENYVEISLEYAKKLGLSEKEIPSSQPIDRIRIYQF